jgi:hypothetical protein
MLRKLRIAFLAMCGILCLLLIALWVRSYWRWDTAEGHVGKTEIRLYSASGHLRLDVSTWDMWGPGPRWDFKSRIIDYGPVGLNPLNSDDPLNRDSGFNYMMNGVFNLSSCRYRSFAWMPFWVPLSLTVMLAAIPWFFWRFSLRTLLIATTLVAAALGLLRLTT